MDVHQAIATRRSVRRFTGEKIDEPTLNRVLDAGRRAPSARNRQKWKFVVVTDEKLKRTLATDIAEQPWIAKAGVVVAVVSTEDYTMHCGVPAGYVDCAIAIDHMTLAAVAEGLGSCWIGHFDQDACKRLLEVPDACEVVELLPIGRPAGDAGEGEQSRKPLQEVVSYDRFA
jgi:nitroreductase